MTLILEPLPYGAAPNEHFLNTLSTAEARFRAGPVCSFIVSGPGADCNVRRGGPWTDGFGAWVTRALPARGAEVLITERVFSTTAHGASSVFATDVDGDIDVLSAPQSGDGIPADPNCAR